MDETEECSVEKIICRRTGPKGGKSTEPYYEVLWEDGVRTTEPLRNLVSVMDMIRECDKRYEAEQAAASANVQKEAKAVASASVQKEAKAVVAPNTHRETKAAQQQIPRKNSRQWHLQIPKENSNQTRFKPRRRGASTSLTVDSMPG